MAREGSQVLSMERDRKGQSELKSCAARLPAPLPPSGAR
jgi:hypothetical protein